MSTAEVKAGEVVLVHAGASGVGTAAVQLARLAGAVPVVTAGSAQKVDAAVALGAAAGFLHSQGDFADGVLGYTGGTSWALVGPTQSDSSPVMQHLFLMSCPDVLSRLCCL